MLRSLCAATLLCALVTPAVAAAPACRPALLASLDMRDFGPLGLTTFTVPAVIDDKVTHVALTLMPHSSVADALVDDKGGPSRGAKIGSLKLGDTEGRDIAAERFRTESDPLTFGGVIGTNVLANFDVELDFAARKVNLFQHEPCPAGGVTWSDHPAAIPFDFTKLRRPAFPMTLDGKPVLVTMDLGLLADSMPVTSANALFGLKPESPGIETHTTDKPITIGHMTFEPEDLTLRRYTFGQLSADSFRLEKPNLILTGKVDDNICDGKTHNSIGGLPGSYAICWGPGDVSLGLATLKKYHLYFAFKELKLYATPATGTP